MPNYLLDTVPTCSDSGQLDESQETLLGIASEDLALLRFSVILAAKLAESGSESAEGRAKLRSELFELRQFYFAKIDEIAMAFGVEKAMSAKDEVERTVTIPQEAMPSATRDEMEELYF